jgi:hypothetical protein
MAKRNRITLKDFFRRGALPSESQFSDLIDSTLNLIDEGFDKSAEYGLEISPLRDQTSLLSFFKTQDPERAVWTIRYDGDRDTLVVESAEQATISLTPDQKVGIRTTSPAWDLDVNGVIGCHGRTGSFRHGAVPADGKWHAIASDLSGCVALEVVAGTGRTHTGHYALMHAFAVNTHNPRGMLFNFLGLKRRIRYHQAYYRSLRSKLKLRWAAGATDDADSSDGAYRLQLRSNRDYGEDGHQVDVRFHITKLWFDPFMEESQPRSTE